MHAEFEGRQYAVRLGSDVHDDGMYLEMAEAANGASPVVLVAFRSDEDGRMTFSAACKDLPLAAVEWFIAEAKKRLRSPGDAA